jgi:hypothetical protein
METQQYQTSESLVQHAQIEQQQQQQVIEEESCEPKFIRSNKKVRRCKLCCKQLSLLKGDRNKITGNVHKTCLVRKRKELQSLKRLC